MSLTPAQRRVLRDVDYAGSMLAEWIHPATRQRLAELGLIEDCARMFYGPRQHRVRCTKAGKALVATLNKGQETK